MIDPKFFFHQPVKGCLRTWYDNIQKVAAGQWDDYTTGCLLDYPYLKKQVNCSRFKSTTSPWYWPKSNATN